MIKIVILAIIAILIWRHWERVKLMSAGILFIIAFAVWGIGFYVYSAVFKRR